MDQAKRGAAALEAGNYAEAIREYTAALAVSPTSPDYLIKRSTAYQRSSPPNMQAASSDADQAVISAQKRAKRELILEAQKRRAIALFGLERFEDAAFVFDIVKRMDPKEKTLPIWERKINDRLSKLREEGKLESAVTVKEIPELEASKTEQAPTTKTENAPPVPTPTSQTPASKIRHDWYQNSENVYFTLMVKGVPKDKASVHIEPSSLSISFPLVTGSIYDFSLDPLFAAVDTSKSTFSVMSTKIEVVLKKAQPGQKWSALEGTERPALPTDSAKEVDSAAKIAEHVLRPSATQPAAPSYPTSSRSGPKNWDKLAEDLTAKKPKKDDGEKGKVQQKDEDDFDYDDEGGDAVNGFFKKLYAGASPEVQRAMMKSFTESNGTALSTNWEEVSKGKVETTPPDGMEAKKWT
ncbi:Cochaperone protein [Zalaria obscura]|uniref:Cochaperone protein n=1 Tax=Zalaria obscura TaxID=2024903 RepID=A0ACC3SE98_9PEZI